MKFRYNVVLLVLLFPFVSSKAQNTGLRQMQLRTIIAYQSPGNNEIGVPAKTTLIVRPEANTIRGHSANDFSFTVAGEKSGIHSGTVLLSDDHETVIFKPYLPFSLNERVSVNFSVAGEESLPPVSYSFRITSISEQEQHRLYTEFRDAEESENSKLMQPALQAEGNNTHEFVVDTIIPSAVAPGDIFLTRNDSKSFIESMDNAAGPTYQFELFNPPSENFRPWQNKIFSYVYQQQVFLLDKNHNPLDTLMCGNGYQTDDHEYQYLPNGHSLLMAYDFRDTDMRKVTGDTNAASHAVVVGSIIQELDTKKNVIFQWRTWEHFRIQDADHVNIVKPNPLMVEYSHLNSLEPDTDGNIIASFRGMSEITKIDRKSGDIIWRWGGKNNMFTFIGDTLPFSYQHDARRTANGHITLMDNGNYHRTMWGNGTYHDTAWSRAIEYELDETDHTAQAVWHYDDIDFTASAGSVQRLPNGNTLICSGPFGLQRVIEVTPENEKVFQLTFPVGAFSYRAFRFPEPDAASVSLLEGEASSFELHSICPNPAHESAAVDFSTDKPGYMEIDIADVLGHTVLRANQNIAGAGRYSATIDVRNLPSGTYVCRLSQNSNSRTKLLVVQQ